MKSITILSLLFFSIAQADQSSTPDTLKPWAEKIEKLNPVSDAEGHGPDIGSEEWMNALDKKLGISDKDGHGPDLGSPEWRKAVEKKLGMDRIELLSSHETKAVFKGISDHKCLGRTSRCPDRCGDSGKLATFEITEYLAYEKPGQYGDPKQETFRVLIEDNMGNAKVPEPIAKAILALKPGDPVLLSWNHNYVTKNRSSSPERVIVKIEAAK